MPIFDFQERQRLQSLNRDSLESFQMQRLNEVLAEILPTNSFYSTKLQQVVRPLQSLGDLQTWPSTTKDELISSLGYEAANRTFPTDRYVRFHRTSGTKGNPLTVLDTAEDWQWWIDGWQFVLDAAELSANDRVFLAFSFGPFVGFWSAFDAAVARGTLVVPSGGLSSAARLELIRTSRATALFCTPSYALHLANVAQQSGLRPDSLGVRKIVVAGEPGGSIPEVRSRLESLWNATLIDHAGATEVGPWGFQAFVEGRPAGVHVNESMFIAEFLSRESGQPAAEGELSELVLTTLGRTGSPVIRYRTGDLVRPRWQHHSRCRFVLLEGGVVGRADDMLVVRGVNVFPSSIEAIMRSFADVDEFRIVVRKEGAMDALTIEVEDQQNSPERIARELQLRIGLKVEVVCVPPGSLPRPEGKAARLVDQRTR